MVGGRNGIISNYAMSGKLLYTFNAVGEIWSIAVPPKNFNQEIENNKNRFESFLTAACVACGNNIYTFDKNISLPPLKYDF